MASSYERIRPASRSRGLNATMYEEIYEVTGPSTSVIVEIEGAMYYVQLVERCFREVRQGMISIDFDSCMGQSMCHRVGVVTCSRCMAASLWKPGHFRSLLRCWRCKRTYRPI